MSTSVSMQPLLTAEDLATYLGVPVATLYAWRASGKGPRGIRIGKFIRYRPHDVETWLDARSTDQETP